MFVAAAAVTDDNAAADAVMNAAAMNDAAAVDFAFSTAANVAEGDSAVAASASLDLNAGTAANAPSFADVLQTNHAASFFCSSPLQTEVSFQRNDWGLDIEVYSPSQMNGQLERTDENATTFERQILSPL